MKNTRILFVVLALVLVVSLVACGGEKTPDVTEAPATTTEAPAVTEAPVVTEAPAVTTVADGGQSTDPSDTTPQTLSLSDYVIVIGNEDYREDAVAFKTGLKMATGILLNVTDKAEEGKGVINYGTLSVENAWEYGVIIDGNSIDLYGAGVVGAQYASELFVSLVDGKGNINAEKALYTGDIRDKFVDGKTYAMQRIFDENGKLSNGGVENPKVFYASETAVASSIWESDPFVVVFIGASNTEGGKEYFKLFAQSLADMLKRHVVYYNAGIGGTGSDLTSTRFYQSAGQYAPDIIVLDENSNDVNTKNDTNITNTEAIIYQIQQLPKVPVVIFNLIPRPAEPDSDIVKKQKAMVETKMSVIRYYGISHIDNYSVIREKWEAVVADLAANGSSSKNYLTFQKSLSDSAYSKYQVFADMLTEYKANYSLPFMAYLTNYYKLDSVSGNEIVYNVHPKDTGYKLIGEVMVEKLEEDPYRYLTNKVMPENFALSSGNKNAKSTKAEYTMIGADGTVLGVSAAKGEKRDITYSSAWIIYSEANQFRAEKNDLNGGTSAKVKLEAISNEFYRTPRFANGIAQAYNASGASFSFKTTADEINFFFPDSKAIIDAEVVVKNESGVTVATGTLKSYNKYNTATARLSSKWIALPGDGKEYTVTVTANQSDLTEGKYICRFGYIVERNYTK